MGTLSKLFSNKTLRKKLLATLLLLALYRLLVFIPVPFADVDVLVNFTNLHNYLFSFAHNNT